MQPVDLARYSGIADHTADRHLAKRIGPEDGRKLRQPQHRNDLIGKLSCRVGGNVPVRRNQLVHDARTPLFRHRREHLKELVGQPASGQRRRCCAYPLARGTGSHGTAIRLRRAKRTGRMRLAGRRREQPSRHRHALDNRRRG